MDQLTPDMIVFIAAPLVLLQMGLALVVLMDRRISSRQRRIMFAVSLLMFVLVGLRFAQNQLADEVVPLLKTASYAYSYAVQPVILVLFMEIIGFERARRVAWALAVVNVAVYLTGFFCPLAFSIGDDGQFIRGPLGLTCHIVCTILLVWLFALAIRQSGKTWNQSNFFPVFSAALLIIAVVLGTGIFWPTRQMLLLTLTMPIACVFLYLWFHFKLERDHEKAFLAEQRIKIMISQIQPHFLYNTLATIQALCLTDPERAAELTEQFATYLRQNIDSLSQSDLIPFEKELEHTRVYADIEMTRFPNVTVDFDVEDANFKVPALSVQPLVENAIRHGVRVREQGRVTVISREEGRFHVVEVRDNGVGFDVSVLAEAATGDHIGLRNVRERVERMCGGTLSVESQDDAGTTVTIRIPEMQKVRA